MTTQENPQVTAVMKLADRAVLFVGAILQEMGYSEDQIRGKYQAIADNLKISLRENMDHIFQTFEDLALSGISEGWTQVGFRALAYEIAKETLANMGELVDRKGNEIELCESLPFGW